MGVVYGEPGSTMADGVEDVEDDVATTGGTGLDDKGIVPVKKRAMMEIVERDIAKRREK